MNRFCERCERVTQDGNLWCERTDCPAEEGHPVLMYGDYLGDLKIQKLLRVWRTSALYEATRGELKVLLKVAHKGDDCEERLKREAVALASLAPRAMPFKSFMPVPRPILPIPLPPYPIASKRPYGEISFRGEIKFFAVYQFAQGKFLSDLMLENPQIWHYQAAWIAIAVAESLKPIAARQKSHLCLSPDMILVDTDKEGYLRPLLLDLGFMVGGNEIESVVDFGRLAEPGYTAPELIATRRPKAVAPSADAYSLGAIFYEMLAGKTAFDSKVVRDDLIRAAVTQHRGQLPVGRPELEHAGVVKVVEQSLAAQNRFGSVTDLGKALVNIYSRPPVEKRPLPTRTKVVGIGLAILALIILGIGAFLLIQVLLAR
jgi:serine/threonine protein kinase